MSKQKNKTLPLKKHEQSLAKLGSNPAFSSIAKLVSPRASVIFDYYANVLRNENYEALKKLVLEIDKKLQKIEKKKLDLAFYQSAKGKIILKKTAQGILDEGTNEKIKAASQLLANLAIKDSVSYDEKEYLADILASLNTFQLSMLYMIHNDVTTGGRRNRGFSWEKLRDKLAKKGISSNLVTSTLSVLESKGLINKNSATLQDVGSTHFYTEFGEEFVNTLKH